jgi:hypothetical protein
VAWPLVVLHVAGVRPGRAPALSTARPFGIWAVPVFSLLAALGLASGRIFGVSVIPAEPDPARFPVAAVERLRTSSDSGRLLTTWTWSGYVVNAWPGKRVFFDPLVFSGTTLEVFGRILLTKPGWRDALVRRDIRFVLAPRHLPLADSLARDAQWRTWYSDPHSIVFVRSFQTGS